MAQAQGSLPSGVPFFSSVRPQRSSVAPIDASISPIGAPKPGVSLSKTNLEIGTPGLSRFVIRFTDSRVVTYLRRYDEAGTWPTIRLEQAKLFASFDTARSIAELLHGDVRRVVVKGHEVLTAITDRRYATDGDIKNRTTPTQQNPASVGEADAGANGGGSEDPPSVLPRTPIPSDAKKLLLEFISRYLGVEIIGIQAGWNQHPDCFLFHGPQGTTMAVPTSVMLLERDAALILIEEKVSAKRKAFEKGQP